MSKLPKSKYDAIRWRKKNGMDNHEIADKVGVSVSTVYKVTRGAKFKKSLLAYRLSLGVQQLNNGAVSAEIAAQLLQEFQKDPKRMKKATARDIKDLGTFSNAQIENGVRMLEKEIREAESLGDPEMEKARALVAKKREAKVVNAESGTEPELTPPAP